MLPIPNYPNYEIDIEGNIRNIKTHHVLKPVMNNSKYLTITVYNENGRKQESIHRLVGYTWLPQPTENQLVIDHIDRNRLNNNASNLRWVTRNMNDLNKITNKELHHIRRLRENGKEYGGYRVEITRNLERIYKSFLTLEQAIEYRDANL
jgi:hypothetical protein